MPLSLVVLAAGIGSRYGGLKQMDPVGPSGEFIVDYSVYDAIWAGFDKVVFVIRGDIEHDFKATIGRRVEKHVAVEYVCQTMTGFLPAGFRMPPERKKPWGTGHAALTAAGAVDEPFAVINADDFYGRHSYEVVARFLRETAGEETRYCMVGFLVRNTVSRYGHVARGVCEVGEAGLLTGVVERTRIEVEGERVRYIGDDGEWHYLEGNERVSMNMWGFKPAFFEQLQEEFALFLQRFGEDTKAEFFVPTVVNTKIEEKRASAVVLETDSRWFGVTYPDDKARVQQNVRALIDQGEYPESLWT